MDPVAASRKHLEALPGRAFILGLGQDPPAAGDHGVGAEDDGAGMASGHLLGLEARQTNGIAGRRLALRGRLVDVGGVDGGGLETDLAEKLPPARRSRSKHQPMRPPHGV